MKKLALATVGVAIVLVGLMTVLYCLPCINGSCSDRDACELEDSSKCSSHHEGCEKGNDKTCPKNHGECKMEGMENGGCKMEGNEHGGCKMEGNEHGGCKMDAKEKEGCDMKSAGSSCSMGNDHGCCCCKMMMMMQGCQMKCDSNKCDSTHVKIRGKL